MEPAPANEGVRSAEATSPYLGGPPDVPSTVVPPPPLGRLGRFELREVLGEGGFGRVYRAFDASLDRQVAVKVPLLPPDQPALLERFRREARSAARLRHPNIVAVFEIGQVGDQFYIVSEFVTGDPLSARVSAERPSLRRAVEWVRSLALALHYAHEEGIVHRDVKPSNIMIDTRGRPQLMDFGLAKQLADTSSEQRCGGRDLPAVGPSGTDAGLTVDGTILGTPAYMSPEQARGDLRAVGPHSDQYSLGVVCYELLTGQRPFRGSRADVLQDVANPALDPMPPHAINGDIPPDLGAICQRAMAKREDGRYSTMADFAIDLQRWLNGEPVSVRDPSTAERVRPPGRPRWYHRHLVAAGLGTAGLLAVVGAALYLSGVFGYFTADRHSGKSVDNPSTGYGGVTADPRGGTATAEHPAEHGEGAGPRLTAEEAESLAWRYANGKGVVKDEKAAAALFRKAAEQGRATAQNQLGWMYANGLGVEMDERMAVAWYRKAAEQGYAIGQANLAWMYETGRGVGRDEQEATKWYGKAAGHGDAHAQFRLGQRYAEGRGVAQNKEQAVKWLRMAAAQGNTEAKELLDKLSK